MVDQLRFPKCKTCQLPTDLVDQIEEARRQDNPVSFTVISAWLQTQGHDLNPLTIPNHFKGRHHESDPNESV